ncbi:MAG: CheY-like chemotaxis protein, partial [Phenylobacterium sp.]
MSQQQKNVLWVDDDHQIKRFRYELKIIKRKLLWQVETAINVSEALEKLSYHEFDAVILDQQLPLGQAVKQKLAELMRQSDLSDLNKTPVWQGCLILYWLRGVNKQIDNAPDDINPTLTAMNQAYQAKEVNRNIPATILSSFYHEELINAINLASEMDTDITIYAKPTN